MSQYPPSQSPYQRPYSVAPLSCSACGKLNPSDARFCNNCATPMISPPSMMSVSVSSQKTGWWESQSAGIKATILIGSLVFLFCIAGLLILEKRDKDQQTQTIASTSPDNSTVQKPYRNLNLWKYNGITTGMTRAEVENILDSKSSQTSDSADSTEAKTTFTWQEGEGKNICKIQITFINGKLHEKSQIGLE